MGKKGGKKGKLAKAAEGTEPSLPVDLPPSNTELDGKEPRKSAIMAQASARSIELARRKSSKSIVIVEEPAPDADAVLDAMADAPKKKKGKKGKKVDQQTNPPDQSLELLPPSQPNRSKVSISQAPPSVLSLDKRRRKSKKDQPRPSLRPRRTSTISEDLSLGSDKYDPARPRTSSAAFDVDMRKKRTSKYSSSELSSESSDYMEEHRSQMSVKKKKQAKKQAEDERKEKKLAKKAKPKIAAKGEKPAESDYGDVKKKLDELKKAARQLGVEDSKSRLDGDVKGPKKKASKKEKAKMTAEMAEKAKAEMEAQAKRLEEIIKKKKEEERLAAIEKDKKENLEQGLRMEQLQESRALIQDIMENSAQSAKEEKQLIEWQNYLECGKLPNPAMCDQMNTYLHLWALDLDRTSIEDASARTSDAIQLLDSLDELIDTSAPEDQAKLPTWKWICQLFREYQSASLDVATYRLLRDVDHNLNRINIPTADFNFKDDYVTLSLWLRVMLPIPLPNPRRPPKPRADIDFKPMDMTALLPATVDCENAAIRGMYLKYDHLSDQSATFGPPQVPLDYHMDLLAITNQEWRVKLKYKYENRDKRPKSALAKEAQAPEEPDPGDTEMKNEEGKRITFEELDVQKIEWQDDVPLVPFKQLDPTPSDFAISIEDQLYSDTRANMRKDVPDHVINLRKLVILGGVFHLNLLAQPPQPQDFVTMDMTITGLSLPKKLEILPFKVVYTPYVPPEPEPSSDSSSTSIRKLPEELEEEIKKQEEELDKLIFINLKWPPHVIFLELPVVCRWDDQEKQWSSEEINDVKHNEDKCMVSFRTGVFGVYALATLRYSNLPFQAYDIKPETDDSVTVQLTAAILMLEFNVKDGLIAITQLQNSPNMTLQDSVGRYMKLHRLKRLMKDAGIDIFPAFDAFCYVDGCCEKQWAMEQHLYYNMAQISNCFNFAWSRWNLQAGRRKIVLQMRQYATDKGKQKNHQMLLVTPLKAAFIDCTEVSQAFSEKEVESLKFCADLYHLMKTTSGIFVRNKVSKASKLNVYTVAQLLISIRVLSFS